NVGESSFSQLVSSRKPFGLDTSVKGAKQAKDNMVMLYGNKSKFFLDRGRITQNQAWIDKYKVLISYAYGAGEEFTHQIINKSLCVELYCACTETYLVIGSFDYNEECKNVISYMSTKFFRFMVLVLKNTQRSTIAVYQLVPMQDFSKPWTDEDLYAKYGLTD